MASTTLCVRCTMYVVGCTLYAVCTLFGTCTTCLDEKWDRVVRCCAVTGVEVSGLMVTSLAIHESSIILLTPPLHLY